MKGKIYFAGNNVVNSMELMNLVYAVELGEKSVHGKKL